MKKYELRKKLLNKRISYLSPRIQQLEKNFSRWGWARVASSLIGVGAVFLGFNQGDGLGWVIFAVVAAIFTVISIYHRRFEKSLKKHQIWSRMKSAQLARMNLDWANIPYAPAKAIHPDHPFNVDIDISGKRSLHHLLDISISQEGSGKLLSWLLVEKPTPADISQRQGIVRELTALPGFREKLLLNFYLVADEKLEGRAFYDRLKGNKEIGSLTGVLIVSAILAVINLGLYMGEIYLGWPSYWIISLGLYVVVYFLSLQKLDGTFADIVFLDEEFRKIRAVLTYLEQYPYQKNSHLANFCEIFWKGEKRPLLQVRRIHWIMGAIGLRMNPVMGVLLNLPGPWDFFFVRMFNKKREHLAAEVERWLGDWQELEAMIALANFAWLHPSAVFPDMKETDQKPEKLITGKAFGHPLIAEGERVVNDFSLEKPGDIVLVTGSNMAGKSTFLKTIGINLALAQAGGAVLAGEMRWRPMRLFTSIKVSDSVTDGFSYFYAEVRRLKGLLNALTNDEDFPVFFLIDEIFKGTNNRERYLGSSAYIKSLADKNGAGLISTHDLELTRLEKEISEFENFHFRETIEDGKMVFDYKLHHGPCPTTNALVIMAMEGLPVDHPNE